MTAPRIKLGARLSVTEALDTFAPEQGGIEFQTDQAGKVHSWHSHSVTETLVVLEGTMTLEWAEGSPENIAGRHDVGPGAVISLPANTIHQSINHDSVCRYLILPEGGKAAETRVFPS
ncbi:homoserine O-acetyltransferase [Leifsonia xyli subsp. cynodontis DSM 46306]|uniref:Cupin type-2 domain-containing protein n=1 Tax=Leifsonia xyli subsp. cynodontis DSM 46306 TaxID=1389489 RepID=U3PA87_LEIXC|nr:cupin domain-containing protein [Leifsonia xyli]AGW42419.1 homoserine O-acetyltransferase [Leifsonia xyli subsp. cynodontis DSM 46306]